MKKILSMILILCMTVTVMVGCSSNQDNAEDKEVKKENVDVKEETREDEQKEEKEETKKVEEINLKVAALSGPTAITMAKLIVDEEKIAENVDVDYEIISAPDVMASKIISKEVDMAEVPINLAAKLYNKGVDYKIAAPNIWGVLYLAGTEELSSIEDIKGKEVYTIGKGLTPDIMFRFILKENNIDPDKDVTIKYMSSPQELAKTMIAGKANFAVMPEPLYTSVLMKNDKVKTVLDIQEAWSDITGMKNYPQSALIVKKETYENYAKEIDMFLESYKESIEWANSNPKEAGEYVEKLNIGLKAAVVEKGMKRSNLNYKFISESKEEVQKYLEVLLENAPESIGGKIPDEGFYLENK